MEWPFGCTPDKMLATGAWQSGGSFAWLPPEPTTPCYLRLSATTVLGLLTVATRWLGDQGREAALNELSAPGTHDPRRTSSHAIADAYPKHDDA